MHKSSFEVTDSVSLFDIVDFVEALEENISSMSKFFGFVSIIAILIINIPLIETILKQPSTFINMLIAADCFLCVGNSLLLFNILVRPSKTPILCLVSTSYGYLINLLNRLLSIGIVVYRYVFVFRCSWVETGRQRKMFSIAMCGGISSIAILATGLCIFYRNQYIFYLGRIYRILSERNRRILKRQHKCN